MPAKCAAVTASCLLLVAATASGTQGQEQSQRSAAPANSGQRQYLSPLDRLKNRSPQQRWENLNSAADDATLINPQQRPFAAKPVPGEDAAIGVFETPRRQPAPDADQFLNAGHEQPSLSAERSDLFDADGTDDEMSRDFPASERVEQDTATFSQAPVEADESIYQEIEEEFPRIRINTTAAPEVEPYTPVENYAPIENYTPGNEYLSVEQPVTEPTDSTYAEPARVAQVPNFEDRSYQERLGDSISSPQDLKPLSGIQPYFDYEPDPTVLETDPYRNVFPRPDGIVESEQGKQFPEVVDLGDELYQHRNLAHVDFQWMATDFWHYPLYFEDVSLERYGHTHNALLQPFVSFGTFGLQFFGLPYQMSINPMCEEQYALGWYRPGTCAPYLYYQVPWNTDAAVRTGAFYTGMIYAFP
ncbi:hypothetical protein Pan258_15760 [Symmachiella dynata]|uniref:hypothetical protein n=2 Tax=Symmachiella dynata TaxID=2527995 RepID=UPI001187BD6A|nr:hypothetical protein [Symmachiella dynata]QDT47540.1 hypothetical protein Pan258_15760 [Symmachiella dynata]